LGEVERSTVWVDGAYMPWDLPAASSRSNVDLGPLGEALRCDIIRSKFERPNVPSQHVRW
jgi:hypothetical protein